ncbi:hypothetical protein HYS42_01050 [Candidatus Saccharibacteria bacterium]|nr:hypothetical protein [Candidatus Saccharibacteria bacterium]
MKKKFSPETVKQVLGNGKLRIGDGLGDPLTLAISRTPLHVDYSPGPEFEPARSASNIKNADEFNAVGSLVRTRDVQGEVHLPVLDMDGGARVQAIKIGSKALLFALPQRTNEEAKMFTKKYGPASLLRDVLGDNGIELEVFQNAVHTYSRMMERSEYEGDRVTALALRTIEKGVFDAVDSTNEGHSHLYINRVFSGADHGVLLRELVNIGFIGEDWHKLAENEGMGIVRTPWTQGQKIRKRS